MSKAVRAITGDFNVDGNIRDRHRGGNVMKLFQIQSRHSQTIGEFFYTLRQRSVFRQPVPAHDHE